MLGFYDYTVILTYLGALFGLLGISMSLGGCFRSAMLCMAAALVCDTLDGMVARRKKNRTRQEMLFGIQIDSLCDLISFGLCPAVMFYMLGLKGCWDKLLLGAYCLCCVIRLGYFNVLAAEAELGVPDAIRIFKGLKAKGELPKVYGIRIDSGDLGYLSKEAKRMFTEAGFPDAIISGSNDLDEYLIQSLKEQGCTVTSWGVGTKIITADGSPSLGGVFKMSAREKDGIFEPVMKISNDVAKMTNPGIKEVRRFYKKSNGKMITDLVCLTSEPMPDGGDYTLVTESAKMVTDQYSHILDDDRRVNAQRLEDAFYASRSESEEEAPVVEDKEENKVTEVDVEVTEQAQQQADQDLFRTF